MNKVRGERGKRRGAVQYTSTDYFLLFANTRIRKTKGVPVDKILSFYAVKNVKNAFMMKGSLPALLSAKTPSDKTAWLQKFNAAISGKA
jgi:hypothetical protein